MAAAAKREPRGRSLRSDVISPRNRRFSTAYLYAQDSGERVQIYRNLEHPAGNALGGAEESDPILNVFFNDPANLLHPDDLPPELGDGWQQIRASAFHTLVEALLDARDAAIRTGMMPDRTTDEEYLQRLDAAEAARNAGRA